MRFVEIDDMGMKKLILNDFIFLNGVQPFNKSLPNFLEIFFAHNRIIFRI